MCHFATGTTVEAAAASLHVLFAGCALSQLERVMGLAEEVGRAFNMVQNAMRVRWVGGLHCWMAAQHEGVEQTHRSSERGASYPGLPTFEGQIPRSGLVSGTRQLRLLLAVLLTLGVGKVREAWPAQRMWATIASLMSRVF